MEPNSLSGSISEERAMQHRERTKHHLQGSRRIRGFFYLVVKLAASLTQQQQQQRHFYRWIQRFYRVNKRQRKTHTAAKAD